MEHASRRGEAAPEPGMASGSIGRLLARVRAGGSAPCHYVPEGEATPLALACQIEDPAAADWRPSEVEGAVGGVLPSDLRELWKLTGGLRLFEDRQYGQWGLVLWAPEFALRRTAQETDKRPEEFRGGDLLIGEFLGDSDLLLVRCDPDRQDFGHAYVVLPIDPRANWPSPSPTLGGFLTSYVDSEGTKFWEPPPHC